MDEIKGVVFMIDNYEQIFKDFRQKYSISRIFASTVGISVLLSLYLILNRSYQNTSIQDNAYLYAFLVLVILAMAIAAYTYLYNFRLMKALEVLDTIIYDYVDPKAYTEYLEATIKFDKKKSVTPALWIAYLKGLSYMGRNRDMADIISNHRDILSDNIQFKAFEFNNMTITDQKKAYDGYYDKMSKKLKSQAQLEALKIKGHFLNRDFKKAIESLENIKDNQTSAMEKVTWNFQMGQAFTFLRRNDEAKPYLDYVVDKGNTSYYVQEAKKLLQR